MYILQRDIRNVLFKNTLKTHFYLIIKNLILDVIALLQVPLGAEARYSRNKQIRHQGYDY